MQLIFPHATLPPFPVPSPNVIDIENNCFFFLLFSLTAAHKISCVSCFFLRLCSCFFDFFPLDFAYDKRCIYFCVLSKSNYWLPWIFKNVMQDSRSDGDLFYRNNKKSETFFSSCFSLRGVSSLFSFSFLSGVCVCIWGCCVELVGKLNKSISMLGQMNNIHLDTWSGVYCLNLI